MRKYVLVSLIVLAILVSGCVSQQPSPKTNTVTMNNFEYSPSPLTVSAGTTVTWINEDSVTHTVTSDAGTFDSGNIGTGQSYNYTFGQPGTYNYYCTIHPYMRASINVQ